MPKTEKETQYYKDLCEALKSMKTGDLQRFFNKNDKQVAVKYLHDSETSRKTILCKLICKAPKFKDTEQRAKAVSFLTKHNAKIPEIESAYEE